MTLTAGRWPRPGEALVSAEGQRVLGLAQPVGVVIDRDGREHPVVGRYAVLPAFEFLQTGVVIAHVPAGKAVRSVYVVVDSAASARTTERAVVAVLAPPDLTSVRVDSPTALADLQRAVGGDLGGYRRGLLLVVQGAGGLLIGVVILAEVLLRRRDLGRRRALGASRPALVLLVVSRTAIAATPGVVVGIAFGTLAAYAWAQPPPPTFGVGTGILTMLAATGAATLPAVLAAWRDPVAVLRTA
jgi:putative ABC transport system permease protein